MKSSRTFTAAEVLVREFEGDIYDGKREGLGKHFNLDGKLVYEGNFVNDSYHGAKGKLYEPEDGCLLYDGAFSNGVKHGLGTLFSAYYSKFKAQQDADGCSQWNQSTVEQGYTSSETKKKFKDSNVGVIYRGAFKNDGIHGNSVKYFHPDGQVAFMGTMLEGKKQGLCTGYYSNGNIAYEGYFAKDQMHGNNNRIYNTNGNLIFNGNILGGKKEGQGHLYYNNGNLKYSGGFCNDKIHGDGIQIWWENGNLKFEGNMIDGKYIFF